MADEADQESNSGSNNDEEENQPEDPTLILTLRTNAKRRHTGVVNRIKKLIQQKAPISEVIAQKVIIEEALDEVTELHNRYISMAVLDENDRETAREWLDYVQKVSKQCSEAMTTYINKAERSSPCGNPANAAKKRKLQLQYELEQSKVDQEREVEDVRKKREREQEDIKQKIALESQLDEPEDFLERPLFSSTFMQTATPPHHLPRITITAFDGDPRKWNAFQSTFCATVHEANVTDSYKLLSLRENLTSDVRRRMAHLFAPPYTYQTAFKELKMKYGSTEVIVQAHVNHLLMVQPIKTGDYKSLFELASLVKDAVSGAQSLEHLQQYTYSTIVQQLSSRLPTELQREWGRYAYPLLPKVASLLDFDKWIDNVVGAEEMRGTKFNQTQRPNKGNPNYGPTIHHINQNEEKNPNQTRWNRCSACRQELSHRLDQCPVFLGLSSTQRATTCASNQHCFKCLGRGHYGRSCKKENTCSVANCNGKHHTLIHGADRVFPTTRPEQQGDMQNVLFVHSPSDHENAVLLAIVPLVVQGIERNVEAYALLDPGSEATLISSKLAGILNLQGQGVKIRFGTFCNSVTLDTQIVNFVIRTKGVAPETNFKFEVKKAFVVPQIRTTPRKVNWPLLKHQWSHLSNLNIPAIDSNQVDVLIGMNVVLAHQRLCTLSPGMHEEGPTAVHTPFGWTVIGEISSQLLKESTQKKGINFCKCEDLENMVQNFWSTDSFGTNLAAKRVMSKDDAKALQILQSSIIRVGGKYQVDLLIKNPGTPVPDNRKAALKRFFTVERQLLSKPEIGKIYSARMNEYIADGHARKLLLSELDSSQGFSWYLPHFFVVNPNKPWDIRIVFDAAAKYAGVSLNDFLLRGPVMLSSLIGVLLRFRQFVIAVSADIQRMYHQVLVNPRHQPLLRFLWREPGSETPPYTFQMLVMPFGTISSSSSCFYALQHAVNENAEYPEVANKIKDNFYADNMLDSFNSEEKAIRFCTSATNSLASGGFRLNQWISSSKKVLATIPTEERSHPDLNLDLDELTVERTLGLGWDCDKDEFFIRVKEKYGQVTTKREMLANLSSIFDPLGFWAPVTIMAKIMFQETWKKHPTKIEEQGTTREVQWDETPSSDILKRWEDWQSELHTLRNLRIPRCFQSIFVLPNNARYELHVFSDASLVAFAAVSYLRITSSANSEVQTSFVMAKSRVAPVKKLSIPRLELQAAVMAARLAETIKQELRIPIENVRYWVDSEIVLRWLNSTHCKYTTFVSNRVSEILESTEPEQWGHVVSADNPADEASRGVLSSNLTYSHRWFHGPTFLSQGTDRFPPTATLCPPGTEDNEYKQEIVVGHVQGLQFHEANAPDVEITKLLDQCKTLKELKEETMKMQQGETENQENEVSGLEKALAACIRLSQRECFSGDWKALINGKSVSNRSKLLRLNPFMDEDGILKVGGRLEHSHLPRYSRHPIILGADHNLTALIIEDAHAAVLHSGVERTLGEVRARYWLIKGRRSVRKVVGKCLECKRQRARPTPPLMAALPKERLEPFLPPFTNVGIDYFGPFVTVVGRRREKRYGCLFTCLGTRGVHLEMTHSLDADSFIMAYRRFIAIRGSPKIIFSDNGTNLAAGEREMREGIENLNKGIVKTDLANRGIEWRFSPPTAPHFGGVWERLVQTSKRALRITLKDRVVSDEVLSTVLAEASSLINGRPLTNVTVDPQDFEPLTPNHFLLGRPHPHIPPEAPEELYPLSKRRWKQSQFIVEQFWKRWMREYVPNLIERRKWFRETRGLLVGDHVLIVDENTRRGEWPSGIVTKLNIGEGGIARSATVKTTNGEFTRPIIKLCILSTAQSPNS